jgi:electron transfer flavoprotein beta subunit
MKILVPLKRVPDPDTRIRLKPDGSGLDPDGVKFAVNPFDAIALEEALRWKERDPATEIVAVTIGGEEAIEQLRTGLAMGADRAVLVRATGPLDSLAVAKVLAALCQREKPDAVFMGKQAIDDDANQTGQMLAALLGVAQATFVSRLERDGTNRVRCARETDAGIETIEVDLRAVFTADLRLNEPRYVSLPGIMKAKRKPIEEHTVAGLGVDAAARTVLLKMELPPRRRTGVKVKTTAELVEKLRLEAKVI